jgi:outer membrane protein OmpA-like peptidoglycan-associated protein
METISKLGVNSVIRNLVRQLVQKTALAVMVCGSFAVAADQQYATPLDWQLSDESVAHGNHSVAELERRLEALNNNGLPSWRYHYVKAAQWLDFARREHAENDRTGAVHSALHQSLSLVVLLEAKRPYQRDSLPLDTPQIEQSSLIRADLWQQISGWKAHQGFGCAEPEIAETEVRLVHASHEYWELGWRHAMGELQQAERVASLVPAKLAACHPLPGVAELIPAAPVVQVVPRYVFFGLDNDMLNSASRLKLDHVIDVLNAKRGTNVRLEGHTDHIASGTYNLALSARRAHAVRSYLMLGGIEAWRIDVRALGEKRNQTHGCIAIDLALDRRVELVYIGADQLQVNADHFGLEIETLPSASCEQSD